MRLRFPLNEDTRADAGHYDLHAGGSLLVGSDVVIGGAGASSFKRLQCVLAGDIKFVYDIP